MLTLKEIKEKAKAHKIQGRSYLSKHALIKALQRKGSDMEGMTLPLLDNLKQHDIVFFWKSATFAIVDSIFKGRDPHVKCFLINPDLRKLSNDVVMYVMNESSINKLLGIHNKIYLSDIPMYLLDSIFYRDGKVISSS